MTDNIFVVLSHMFIMKHVLIIFIISSSAISTEAPKFKSTPEDRTARLGYAASMSCRPDGVFPHPITQENWLKNGQPLSSVDLASQRIRVLSYGNLHFARTRREDTAIYSCVLKNTMGTVTASAQLTVEGMEVFLFDDNSCFVLYALPFSIFHK